MAVIPNGAALVATAAPWPWQGEQLLAFRGEDQFGIGPAGTAARFDAIARGRSATPGTYVQSPSLPVPLQVGGFCPAALAQRAAGLIGAATDAAGRVLQLLAQVWGAINSRNVTPGSPAQYAKGSPIGRWDPEGINVWGYSLIGRAYAINILDVPQAQRDAGYQSGELRTWIRRDWTQLGPGRRLVISYWPDLTQSAFNAGMVYTGDAYVHVVAGNQEANLSNLWDFLRLQGFSENSSLHLTVEPAEGEGVPYPPDVPAVDPVPDPFALVPVPPVSATPATAPNAAGMVPARLPTLPTDPQAIPGSQPVTQPAAQTTSTPTGVTTTTTVTTFAPVVVPSLPRRVTMPQTETSTGTRPSGQPEPAVSAKIATTPTDARRYGTQTVTSGAPATSPQAIASELGRVEQKVGLLLPLLEAAPSWVDRIGDAIRDAIVAQVVDALLHGGGSSGGEELPPATYSFIPPYDTPGTGLAEEAVFDIPADTMGPAVVARLDAIAEALQVMSAWRVKLSKGNAVRPNVTLTAHGYTDT